MRIPEPDASEPAKSAQADAAHARESKPARVFEAATGAFSEFLSRDLAFVALAFVVLFKFTDALSGAMTAPFVIDLGFSRNEYAAIIKGVGLAATLIGGFAGGFVARAYPLATSLWIGGLLQAAANLAFSWQAGEGWYLPVRGPAGEPVLDLGPTLDLLRPVLENAAIAKVNARSAVL